MPPLFQQPTIGPKYAVRPTLRVNRQGTVTLLALAAQKSSGLLISHRREFSPVLRPSIGKIGKAWAED